MKEKLAGILEAIVIIAFGIIIAVFGGGTALDVYFAIVALVAGVVLAIVNVYTLVKAKELAFGLTFLSTALIVVGIALLTNWLSFAVLINLAVFLILGLGIALVLYGLYVLALKKNLFYGVGQIVVGAVLAVLAIIFLAVPEFRTAFWIIIGIVVAVYGVLLLVTTLLSKSKKK